MGRRIPLTNNNNGTNGHPIINPSIISLCLLLMGISITATLCGFRFRRKPKPQSPSNSLLDHNDKPSSSENLDLSNSPAPPATSTENEASEDQKELPLPPAKQQASSSVAPANLSPSNNINQYMKKSASTRNFKAAISLKMPRTMSVSRSTITKKIEKERKGGGGKTKNEDSIWTKTIILGEKCKVPDEEDEDVVVRDGQGRRVTAYHPRSSSVLPTFSRQESF